MKVGVLALQGAFRAHLEVLAGLGVEGREVRQPDDLGDVAALVLPGGESTTMDRLLDTSGLRAPVGELLAAGLPAFGTCAGMILLAREVLDGRPDQRPFGLVDMAVRRNGYGRQVDSFEADLRVEGLAAPFHAVFIRAPVVESVGAETEVLAEVEGRPVLCRQGPVWVSAFHPELSGDYRLHAAFLDHAASL
jgi:pyridoxal 5'-phosphate synthase pdxT subunit